MGGSAVVGAEAFRRGSGFATGARPWLRYVDQCVPVKLEKVPMELLILLLEKDGHLVARQVKPVLRADEHGNRPVRGSAASRQPLRGPGARLLRRRHDG